MTAAIRIGMIVPPLGDQVPPEAHVLYPEGVGFAARSLGIEGVDPASFDKALEGLPSAVQGLRGQGVDAISLMGTSLSFYRGWEGHQELLHRLESLSGGTPVTTMALSIIRGLRQAKAVRVHVGVAYNEVLQERLVTFLEDDGFHVVGKERMDMTSVESVLSADDDAVIDLGERLMGHGSDVDAILISCGGLRTIEATEQLQAKYKIPVISSAVAGCHGAVALVDDSLERVSYSL